MWDTSTAAILDRAETVRSVPRPTGLKPLAAGGGKKGRDGGLPGSWPRVGEGWKEEADEDDEESWRDLHNYGYYPT